MKQLAVMFGERLLAMGVPAPAFTAMLEASGGDIRKGAIVVVVRNSVEGRLLVVSSASPQYTTLARIIQRHGTTDTDNTTKGKQ